MPCLSNLLDNPIIFQLGLFNAFPHAVADRVASCYSWAVEGWQDHWACRASGAVGKV